MLVFLDFTVVYTVIDNRLLGRCLEEGAQMFILKPLKQSDVKKLRCLIY